MEVEPGARTSSEIVAATPLHHTVRMMVESCGRSAMSTYKELSRREAMFNIVSALSHYRELKSLSGHFW